MQSVFPTFLAAAIAFFGVCIAWAQWYTARQKLIIDLRDKLYASYRSVLDALEEVNRSNAPKHKEWVKVDNAISERRLLFGAELIVSFRVLRDAMYDMVVAERSERSYSELGDREKADDLHRMSIDSFKSY